jgi:hypothetical protein
MNNPWMKFFSGTIIILAILLIIFSSIDIDAYARLGILISATVIGFVGSLYYDSNTPEHTS